MKRYLSFCLANWHSYVISFLLVILGMYINIKFPCYTDVIVGAIASVIASIIYSQIDKWRKHIKAFESICDSVQNLLELLNVYNNENASEVADIESQLKLIRIQLLRDSFDLYDRNKIIVSDLQSLINPLDLYNKTYTGNPY